MPQELLSVSQRFECRGLLLGVAAQRETYVRAAKIRRKMNLGNDGAAHARIRHLVADQLVQFLANAFRDALGAVGVQILEYRNNFAEGR